MVTKYLQISSGRYGRWMNHERTDDVAIFLGDVSLQCLFVFQSWDVNQIAYTSAGMIVFKATWNLVDLKIMVCTTSQTGVFQALPSLIQGLLEQERTSRSTPSSQRKTNRLRHLFEIVIDILSLNCIRRISRHFTSSNGKAFSEKCFQLAINISKYQLMFRMLWVCVSRQVMTYMFYLHSFLPVRTHSIFELNIYTYSYLQEHVHYLS